METKRDQELYQLIGKFKVLSTSQIHKLIYSNVSEKFCRERLKKLADRKSIRRSRYHIDQEYVYHYGKLPPQLNHKLRLVDAYISLKQCGEITVFDIEFIIENIRADAYMEVIKDGKMYSFFIEIHQFNDFNFEKYIKFYTSGFTQYFTVFPRIIVVTDKKINIPQSHIKFIHVKNDMHNIAEVFV